MWQDVNQKFSHEMVKISIIIAIYNSQEYLANCLESICNQTLRDIEIICINDCSNDNSLLILQEYIQKDERIKLIAEQASGFLYYVSLKGVTGAANIDIKQVSEKVNNIKKYSDLPVAVGFGVRDADTAKSVAEISDAVVIGSRIVKEIEASEKNHIFSNVKKLVESMKNAIDSSKAQ